MGKKAYCMIKNIEGVRKNQQKRTIKKGQKKNDREFRVKWEDRTLATSWVQEKDMTNTAIQYFERQQKIRNHKYNKILGIQNIYGNKEYIVYSSKGNLNHPIEGNDFAILGEENLSALKGKRKLVNKEIKVFIYIRQSSTKDNSFSKELQLQELLGYVVRRNEQDMDISIVGIFEETGSAFKDTHRLKERNLMMDIINTPNGRGNPNLLIIYSWSRLSRNIDDSLEILDLLKRRQINILEITSSRFFNLSQKRDYADALMELETAYGDARKMSIRSRRNYLYNLARAQNEVNTTQEVAEDVNLNMTILEDCLDEIPNRKGKKKKKNLTKLDQILKLENLLENELITEEDFNIFKNELMNK